MTDPHHILTLATLLGALGLWLMLPRGTARGRGVGIVLAGDRAGAGRLAAAAAGRLDGRRRVPDPGRPSRSSRPRPRSRSAIRSTARSGSAMSLLGTAGLFLFTGAQFLAVATVVVYAGAILVTFLFVLMLAQPEGKAAYDRVSWEALLSAAAGVVIVGVLSMTIGGVFRRPSRADRRDRDADRSEPGRSGVLAPQTRRPARRRAVRPAPDRGRSGRHAAVGRAGRRGGDRRRTERSGSGRSGLEEPLAVATSAATIATDTTMPHEIALLNNYLIVGAMLFGIGLIGFLSRRNMIVMFLSAEMMLQGVSLSLVAWSRFHNDFGGQMLVMFIIAVAACEAAIALALVLMLFQRRGKLDIADWQRAARGQSAAVPRRAAAAESRRSSREPWPHLPPAGVQPEIPPEETDYRPRRIDEPIMFDIKTLLILIPALAAGGDAADGRAGPAGAARAEPLCRRSRPLALSFVASIVLVFQVQRADRADGRAGRTGPIGQSATSRSSRSGRWAQTSPAMPIADSRRAAGRRSADRPRWRRLPHRRRPAGRSAHGRHAGHRHLHLARWWRSTRSATCTAIPGYWRFFTYIGLFVFSMTMLVSASNFVLLYVFWEAVGLCSYLLIGFWYREARGGRGRQEGVPGQPHRRLRLRPGRLPDLDDLRHARLPRHVAGGTVGRRRARADAAGRAGAVRRRRRGHGDLPAAVAGGVRQERPVPAARLAARRHGRPHARQRLDPRGHDGHGRRVHGRPLHAAVRRLARRPVRRGRDRRRHGPAGRRSSPSRKPT